MAENVLALNTRRFTLTLVGALFVITGSILKNSATQLEESEYEDKDSISFMRGFGPILCMVGWALVVYAIAYKANGYINVDVFSKDNYRGMIALVSGIMIVISGMMIRSYMETGEPVPNFLTILLVIGWLGIGYSSALTEADKFFSINLGKGIFALVGVGSVLFSILYVLPTWDRPNDITDGFGMPLLALTGWGGIILANSLMEKIE